MKSDGAAVTLKEYVDSRLQSLDLAATISGKDIERRLDELNRLRRQVTDDRGMFVTRERYDQTEEERSVWREQMANRLTAIETRSVTWTSALGIFFTFIQMAGAFVLYWLLHK